MDSSSIRNPVNIIGIAGAKQSGKTTLALELANRLFLWHTSFAAPIREFVANLVGVSLEDLEAIKESPIAWLDGRTPRYLMQTIGTEWGRQMVHPELWVRRALDIDHGFDGVVISDVRFENEAKAIRDRGGVILRLHRHDQPTGDTHVSEKPLPNQLVDHELTNRGTVDELVERVVKTLGLAG